MIKYLPLLIFLWTTASDAQNLRFTNAFGPQRQINLQSTESGYMDSIRRLVHKNLKKNECVIINYWHGDYNVQNKIYIVNRNFDTLTEPESYCNITAINDNTYIIVLSLGIYPLSTNTGILDLNQKLILPPVYRYILPLDFKYQTLYKPKYPNYLKCIKFTNGRETQIFDTKKNSVIFKGPYENLELLNDQYLIAQQNNKFGIVDFNNRVLIPFNYLSLGSLVRKCNSNEIIAQDSNRKYGVINLKNEVLLPFQYHSLSSFKDSWVYFDLKQKQYTRNGYLNIFTQAEQLVDTAKPSAQLAPASLSAKYSPLVKPKYLYTYKSKTRYLKATITVLTINNWRNPDDPSDLIDTQFYTYDTLTGTIPIQKQDSTLGYSNTVYMPFDSIGTDSLYSPEALLELVLQNFSNGGIATSVENLPAHTAESFLQLLPFDKSYFYLNSLSPWHVQQFVNNNILPIIHDTALFNQLKNWSRPYFKSTFNKLPAFCKTAYKNTASYMVNYLKYYDLKKVEKHLQKPEFIFNTVNPFTLKPDARRKLSSFIDQQILVQHTLTLQQAQAILIPLFEELLSWD